ncbi:GFA family protein [Devosia sp.]|uniref:GFA family protein n=1 Tax=Devosia sp. TaxID=1871048 RepID=UPI003A94B036
MANSESRLTGGCQCGAVRYALRTVEGPALCHCRMCQKAFGSYFAPLGTAIDLVWTRGAPSRFNSSNRAARAFCSACGTPLAYLQDDGGIELALGTLDDPSAVPPVKQINDADALPFFATLHTLPNPHRGDDAAFNATVTSYQHPDHDTEVWPTEGGTAK